MSTSLIRFLDRQFGKLVCWAIGGCTADWTWARMTGSRPICRFCKRTIGG